MNIVKSLWKSKVVHNAGWLMSGKIFQMLIKLIVGMLTARYLGPANYGLISYAAAYTNFFYAFCVLGINSIILKELIDTPEDEGTILGTSLTLRMCSSFISTITILIIVYVIDKGDPLSLMVVGLSCIGMIFQAFELFNYWFQSKLQSKVTAIVALVAYTITSIYKCYLIFTSKSVQWFALATSVDYICIGAMLYFVYHRDGGRKLVFSIEKAINLLSKSYNFMLSSIMFGVYAQTDKIMLRYFISSEEVGYYSIASSLSVVWCFILSAIITSVYPEIAKAYNTDKNKFVKLNKILYSIIFYVSGFVGVCFTIFGDLAIKIMYGAAYTASIVPLKILAWCTMFTYLGVARDAWVACEGKQSYLKYTYVASAVTNVILNFVLIPVWGASGASIASLISQIIAVIIAPLCMKELRENAVMMLQAFVLKLDGRKVNHEINK